MPFEIRLRRRRSQLAFYGAGPSVARRVMGHFFCEREWLVLGLVGFSFCGGVDSAGYPPKSHPLPSVDLDSGGSSGGSGFAVGLGVFFLGSFGGFFVGLKDGRGSTK